ncbi:MAG: transglycosylase domain-containing protein [Anaerolineae bacterium]
MTVAEVFVMDLRSKKQLLGLIISLLLISALAAGIWLVGDLPAPTDAALRAVRPSTRLYDRKGQLLFEAIGDEGKQTSLAFKAIPAACWQATVAVEDSRFFEHPGVDVLAIGRAALQNLQNRTVISGASTITQQLARNTLMTEEERYEQSLRRKLREAWLALRIEQRFSKEEILARYLNQVYYGNFAYGLEAAAHSYFGKSARDLDLAECSLLAGLVQNPAVYQPLQNLEAARWRQSTVLSAMVAHNYIARSDAELALAEQLQFAATPFPIEAPHFVSYVEAQLERLLGTARVSEGGLRVTTTLDLAWNRAAESAVRYRLQQLADAPDAPQDRRIENAAVVILDPQTGAIRTLVGSPDYFDASIDGALNAALALRQPGSALKPLTYAAAMDPQRAASAGRIPFTPATVLADVRTAFLTAEGEPYVPQNYDLQWHGPVSVRTALASSYNVPAVKTLESIGIAALIDQAQRQGITTFQPASADSTGQRHEPYGLALTLGGGEVSLLELTGAYSVFANGGWRVAPYAIARIEDETGKLLWQAPASTRQPAVRALDARVAYLITDMLSDDDARAPSFGRNSLLHLSRPAAAKTGTTTDWRDNWTVGYTPQLAVGVWVGNADSTPMLGVNGVTGAGPIWHDVMELVHRGLPVQPFDQPDGLLRAEVCIDSGLLPTQWCSRRRGELFIAGTEPSTYDTVYRPVVVDRCRGGLADAQTTPACRAQQVQRVYPPELREWAAAQGIAQPLGNAGDDLVANAANPTAPAALDILSPDPNSVYRLSAGLNGQLQQIRLAARANGTVPAAQITFLVDNVPVGSATRIPYEIWWTLQAGRHQITAVANNAAGEPIARASVWIEVE